MKINNRFYTLTTAGVVFVFHLLSGQTIAPLSGNPFDLDVVQFWGGDGKTKVEINQLIPKRLFRWTESQNGFEFQALAKVEILQGNTPLQQDMFRLLDHLLERPTLADLQIKMAALSRFYLDPGAYTVRSELHDLISDKIYTQSKTFQVRSIASDQLTLSDLLLATSIIPRYQDTSDPFYKNGLQVTPNACCIYGLEIPVLYVYSEIYGLAETTVGTYTLRYTILGPDGEQLVLRGPFTRRKPGTSSVEYLGINIVSLPPNSYTIKLQVTDNDTGEDVEQSRPFYVFKKSRATVQRDIATELNSMSPAEFQQLVNIVGYLLPAKTVRDLKKLSRPEQVQWLVQYFAQQDTLTETPENEYYQQLRVRMEYVDRQFSTQRWAGWKTDRGRIYLKYGIPDDILQSPPTYDTYAFERWIYRQPNQEYEFVFVDQEGEEEYILVHSTHPNEYQDYDWKQKIFKAYIDLDY